MEELTCFFGCARRDGEFEQGFARLLRALRIEPSNPTTQPAASTVPVDPGISDRAAPDPPRPVSATVPIQAAGGVDLGPRAASVSSLASPPAGVPEGDRAGPASLRRPYLLWIATVAMVAWTALLLGSSGADFKAGMWFLGSALLLIVGSLLCVAGKARPATVCRLGAGGQLVVLVGMLVQSIGDGGFTVPMNLAIAGLLTGLAVYCAKMERRSPASGHP